MEQRKLLWVILLVSLFMLIIFGSALILYSPSRSSNTAYADGEVIPYEGGQYSENHAVDPDKWARNPDQIAGLDKNAVPATGNIINLTIVNDRQSGQDQNIDVSGLTNTAQTDETGLSPELAAQIGITPERLAKKTNTSVAEKTQAVSAVEKEQNSRQMAALVKKQKNTIKQSAHQKKQTVQKPKKVKKTSPKETVFWVQTASLTNRINAEKARDQLAAQHMQVEVFTKQTASGLTYRVRVGPFINKAEASYWLNTIKKIKEFSGSYISEEKVKR